MEEKEKVQNESGEVQESKTQQVQTAEFPSFETEKRSDDDKSKVAGAEKLDMLLDVTLPVTVELGKTTMYIKDILELQRGSVIELDKLASEPVDVIVNGKKIAEGEVVVVDKHFGIRITNLVAVEERIKR